MSTTDLVGRMLLLWRDKPAKELQPGPVSVMVSAAMALPLSVRLSSLCRPALPLLASPDSFLRLTRLSSSLKDSQRYARASFFVLSSDSSLQRRATDRVVYVDGGFDLFHVGHIEFLRVAREQGTYLIVGIHTDQDINLHKAGMYMPLCF